MAALPSLQSDRHVTAPDVGGRPRALAAADWLLPMGLVVVCALFFRGWVVTGQRLDVVPAVVVALVTALAVQLLGRLRGWRHAVTCGVWTLLGLAAGFLSGLGQVLSQALLLILIVAFFLAERGMRDQTFHPGGTAARVARDVRQYLVITALTGLGFSLLVYFLMLAVGTDLPLVWAVLAFIMNFVPNVGIILSVVPPAILTLLELGWQRALMVLAGFLVLNFVVDNLVKPRFMQSGLDVPPLVGLLSLVIWAYLLGPIGTLLALPLTIAVRRVLEDADVVVPGLSRGAT